MKILSLVSESGVDDGSTEASGEKLLVARWKKSFSEQFAGLFFQLEFFFFSEFFHQQRF